MKKMLCFLGGVMLFAITINTNISLANSYPDVLSCPQNDDPRYKYEFSHDGNKYYWKHKYSRNDVDVTEPQELVKMHSNEWNLALYPPRERKVVMILVSKISLKYILVVVEDMNALNVGFINRTIDEGTCKVVRGDIKNF